MADCSAPPRRPLMSFLKRHSSSLAGRLAPGSGGWRGTGTGPGSGSGSGPGPGYADADTAPAAQLRPRTITRVDRLWAPPCDPDLPVLNIDEIIRARDSWMLAADIPPPPPLAPHSASADSERTLADALPAGAEQGRRRLRHDYYTVATMDGASLITGPHRCPIALCGAAFARFEDLQAHWTEHPWNRGGILTPVCAGGVRRLGWLEHKRRFFGSLVHSLRSPAYPEDDSGDGSSNTPDRTQRLRKRTVSMDEACRSDYGDIHLLGSRTYHVSPRRVPMQQVAQWEAQRDALAAGGLLADTAAADSTVTSRRQIGRGTMRVVLQNGRCAQHHR
ncbi:hypothetical protein H4R18_003241 [Coemansia javaensis]|uniref:C2H2-type domain-containing protein n=1 Tax=Coemansia javaensis TaxID=2761396 RepID=A0A9W8H8J9_9FUNG|nr:hypothetical protein H4R18_003241 [Coemansia javaensis]